MPRHPQKTVGQTSGKRKAPEEALNVPARRVRLTLAKLASKVGLTRSEPVTLPVRSTPSPVEVSSSNVFAPTAPPAEQAEQACSAPTAPPAEHAEQACAAPTAPPAGQTSPGVAGSASTTPSSPNHPELPRPELTDEMKHAQQWHFDIMYPSLCKAEEEGCLQPSMTIAMATQYVTQRAKIVDWIVRRHSEYALRKQTLCLAVRLIDRYLVRQLGKPHKLYLIGAAALAVASKFEDEQYPDAGSLARDAGATFEAHDLHKMEITFLEQLEFRLHIPTVAHHLDAFLVLDFATDGRKHLAHYLMELGLQCPELAFVAPTLHAAAAALLSGLLCGRKPPVKPPLKERLLVDKDHDMIEGAARVLMEAVSAATEGNAIYDKYAQEPQRKSALAMASYVASSAPPDIFSMWR